jgi:PAS domain S-box-containing protein
VREPGASSADLKPKRERRAGTAAHLRSILDAALDAVVGMDATGRVTFWNPRAEQIFGWTRDEAVGQMMSEMIIPPGHRAAHAAGLERFLRTGEARILDRRVELTALRRDGTVFPVELAITHVAEGGYHTFTAFVRDITGRKRAEEERERMLAVTEAARDQAEDANRAKDQFLAILSHELRTPLTSIVGWVYLLRSGAVDQGTLAKGLETIERNVMTQAQLVGDILDMSRIMSARLRLNPRPLELSPLIAAVLDSLLPAARAKSIRLLPVLDPSAGPVLGDPDRLQQVVWNLVSNAIKFTPAGGQVQVRLSQDDGIARLAVQDTGMGIPPEFLPHVFEMFRQRDSSDTRPHGGVGLGLALVRQLVELHGGEVQADSAGEGQGATFTVTLPIVRGLEPVSVPAVLPALDAMLDEPDLLSGLRVLLAENGAEAREAITGVLTRHGADVTTVSSGAEALEAIVQRPPDVLVTDVEIPGESGYTLVGKVRALPAERGGRTPAVALSSMGRTEDRVASLEAGFQVHLSKPVPPTELVAAVASLAGRTPPR